MRSWVHKFTTLFEKDSRSILAYHITSDLYLPSIMKKGLLANPPQRRYSVSTTYKGDYRHPSGVTVGQGIYFGRTISIIRQYLISITRHVGGNPLLVIVHVDPLYTIPDEDDITNSFEEILDTYSGKSREEGNFLRQPHKLLRLYSSLEGTLPVLQKDLETRLDIDLSQIPRSLLFEVFRVGILRRLQYTKQRTIPIEKDDEQKYRQTMQAFLLAIRRLEQLKYDPTFWLRHSVTFTSQRARIYGICRLKNTGEGSYEVETLYGDIPPITKTELKEVFNTVVFLKKKNKTNS